MDEVTEKKEKVLDPATSQMKEQAEAAVENLASQQNTGFVENEDPTKNATKVEIDLEANRPFIEEMRAKIAALHDPEAIEELKKSFKEMSNMEFDEASKGLEEKRKAITEEIDGQTIVRLETDEEFAARKAKEAAEGNPVDAEASKDETAAEPEKPSEPTVKETDDSEDVTDEERTQNQLVLERLDKAIEDPDSMRITNDEIEKIIKANIGFDAYTINFIAKEINDDIDRIKNWEKNPDGSYKDEENRVKAIKETLAVKVSTEEVLRAWEENNDPVQLEKLYHMRYPEYTQFGPGSIFKNFNEYITRRIEGDLDWCAREMITPSKQNKIIKDSEEQIFRYIATSNGKRYTLNSFIQTMWRIMAQPLWERFNKEYPAKYSDQKKFVLNDEPVKAFIATYICLILRWMYKHQFPRLNERNFQKKLLHQFLLDILNPMTLNPEHTKFLKENLEATIDNVMVIEKRCEELNRENLKKRR